MVPFFVNISNKFKHLLLLLSRWWVIGSCQRLYEELLFWWIDYRILFSPDNPSFFPSKCCITKMVHISMHYHGLQRCDWHKPCLWRWYSHAIEPPICGLNLFWVLFHQGMVIVPFSSHTFHPYMRTVNIWPSSRTKWLWGGAPVVALTWAVFILIVSDNPCFSFCFWLYLQSMYFILLDYSWAFSFQLLGCNGKFDGLLSLQLLKKWT